MRARVIGSGQAAAQVAQEARQQHEQPADGDQTSVPSSRPAGCQRPGPVSRRASASASQPCRPAGPAQRAGGPAGAADRQPTPIQPATRMNPASSIRATRPRRQAAIAPPAPRAQARLSCRPDLGAGGQRAHRRAHRPPSRGRAWTGRRTGAARSSPVLQAPHGDPHQRFPNDRAAHLARAELPLGERDRHLDHPGPDRTARQAQVDLEAVALAGDIVDGAGRSARRGRPGSRRWRPCSGKPSATACSGCPPRKRIRRCAGQSHHGRRARTESRAPGRPRAAPSSSRGSCSGACEPSASISTTTW